MTPKQRLRRLSAGLALVLAAGLGYAGWVHLTHLALPCPFHAVTGLLCPGCGVTRMCLALLRLDLSAAWSANPGMLVLSPLLLGLLSWHAVTYIRTGNRHFTRGQTFLCWTLVGLFFLHGLLRNLL